jgi:hypothetical protein
VIGDELGSRAARGDRDFYVNFIDQPLLHSEKVVVLAQSKPCGAIQDNEEVAKSRANTVFAYLFDPKIRN